MEDDKKPVELEKRSELSQIADAIVKESDPQKIKDLTELFNSNANKRKIVSFC